MNKSRLGTLIQPLKKEPTYFALEDIHRTLESLQTSLGGIKSTSIIAKPITRTIGTVQSTILGIDGLPLIPKGSLITSNGKVDLALPIGSDKQVLTANSLKESGMDWETIIPILFQTNGVPNGSQLILNLKNGTNLSITDDGLGGLTFNAVSGSGINTLPLSSTPITLLGTTVYPATITLTPGANHVLHLRVGLYRSSTAIELGIFLAKDTTHGYVLRAQNDGNLVNYLYNTNFSAINASGAGTDDVKGPVLFDMYFIIGAIADKGLGIGGQYYSPNVARLNWINVTNNTTIDMTGALTVGIEIDAFANINEVQYEIL